LIISCNIRGEADLALELTLALELALALELGLALDLAAMSSAARARPATGKKQPAPQRRRSENPPYSMP